mmetsp:Transcript_21113/g.42266  ORF Transcript_21113/g.42266 Transcript_21113/m.42266 type:complete len:184 (+) Transcript_21113:1196-1747(+)|eukprot:CAMPEP_0194349632 /NCGR_PEP_ID=MMETSP0171-20130528/107194_1 /TAXON_ID=218684 /ORGANISM="Corethron pennatum, Strain L29A3" /LENGTH=183 /DNA_ID=CAMNT_0039117101 /DNA_START=1214 /DNA_END=1765 /DNA_ORIENTATION=-
MECDIPRGVNDTNRAEKQGNTERESRTDSLCCSDQENFKPEENTKRRILQRGCSSPYAVPTRAGCGFRVDQMALKFVLQRSPLWQQNHLSNKEDRDQENLAKQRTVRQKRNATSATENTEADYGAPLTLPQDRLPDALGEERVDLKGGQLKNENRDTEQSGEFWIGFEGKLKVDQRDAQKKVE